jgi:hypothetical protein
MVNDLMKDQEITKLAMKAVAGRYEQHNSLTGPESGLIILLLPLCGKY